MVTELALVGEQEVDRPGDLAVFERAKGSSGSGIKALDRKQRPSELWAVAHFARSSNVGQQTHRVVGKGADVRWWLAVDGLVLLDKVLGGGPEARSWR